MRAVEAGSRAEAGSSMQQHFRVGGQGAGDAQPLLLAAGQVQGRVVQPVLDLVPQGRPRRQRSAISRSRARLRRPATRGPKTTFSKTDLGNGFDF